MLLAVWYNAGLWHDGSWSRYQALGRNSFSYGTPYGTPGVRGRWWFPGSTRLAGGDPIHWAAYKGKRRNPYRYTHNSMQGKGY